MMFIAEMRIKDVPPFRGEVDFKFDKRVNVFIGPNAVGKSTLLQYLLTEYQKDRWDVDGGDRPMSRIAYSVIDGREAYSSQSSTFSFEWQRSEISFDAQAGTVSPEYVPSWDFTDVLESIGSPVVAIPATRVKYDKSADGYRSRGFLEGLGSRNSGVGMMSDPLYGSDVHKIVSDIYDLINDAADDDYYLSESVFPVPPKDMAANFLSAIELAFRCAQDICQEVILRAPPSNETTITHTNTESGLPAASARVDIGVRIPVRFQNEREPLQITSLSAGTEGTLWWIRLVALTLLHAANYQPGWEKKPAILLIDEIENHLHPTWQRRVIPALLEHFPGLQIFATTHSPFVVAGLKKGQVHRLYRDEEGIVRAEPPNNEAIMGWTMDEILRGFMGVQDPTDDETSRNAAELRRLRAEGPRDTEDGEAARQERMQELRRLVDRDLLAGGPAAAQRELFEQQFAEALEKYQQSRDLGQDSG